MAYAEKQAQSWKKGRSGFRMSVRMRNLVLALTSFTALIVIWMLITGTGAVRPLFLPGPPKVLATLYKTAMSGQLAADLWISLWRIMIAFAMSCVVAIPGGIMIGSYKTASALVQPVVDFIRYMPVVAFVPLSILWCGTGEWQKYVIIFVGTFFQQILMVQDCVKRVPKELVDVGRTLEMPEHQIMLRIVLPAAAPGIWDAMRTTLGWAWSWLVLAELVAANSGLGYRITVAQRYLQTDLIIGYVLLLGVLGLITDQLMRGAEKRMFAYLGAQ